MMSFISWFIRIKWVILVAKEQSKPWVWKTTEAFCKEVCLKKQRAFPQAMFFKVVETKGHFVAKAMLGKNGAQQPHSIAPSLWIFFITYRPGVTTSHRKFDEGINVTLQFHSRGWITIPGVPSKKKWNSTGWFCPPPALPLYRGRDVAFMGTDLEAKNRDKWDESLVSPEIGPKKVAAVSRLQCWAHVVDASNYDENGGRFWSFTPTVLPPVLRTWFLESFETLESVPGVLHSRATGTLYRRTQGSSVTGLESSWANQRARCFYLKSETGMAKEAVAGNWRDVVRKPAGNASKGGVGCHWLQHLFTTIDRCCFPWMCMLCRRSCGQAYTMTGATSVLMFAVCLSPKTTGAHDLFLKG